MSLSRAFWLLILFFGFTSIVFTVQVYQVMQAEQSHALEASR
jgi:hypothetical protein